MSGIAGAVTVFTIGHSTRTIAEFVALLAQVAVESVVDVRSIPRSRTNPQFNADILPGSLAEAGMTYRHLRTLGGRRHRSQDQTPSPNTLWRNESFRNYADYAASEAFRAGLDELEALARRQCCAVMCAEVLWWRCHRRIIADVLTSLDVEVLHIRDTAPAERHRLAPPARIVRGVLTYSVDS